MNSDFWDTRYAEEEFVYGEEPNEFFKKHIDSLEPGQILLPAEGEGRNSVYAARNGWEAYAFDISHEGLKKATQLAKKYEVSIHYAIGGYADVDYLPDSMDAIAFIFAHVTPEVRRPYYRKLLKSLKPGGIVILEGFHKDQFGKNSGGPKDKEMLYDEEQLREDFYYLHDIEIVRSDRILNEGKYHDGEACLVQFVGYK